MAIEIDEQLDELGHPIIYIKDLEKSASTYSVVKGRNGFAFYEIAIDRGRIPDALQSQYTNLRDAENAVKRYLEIKPKSPTVKRNANTEARLAQKKKQQEQKELEEK